MTVAVGTITAFAGSSASVPSGWVICDGSSYLRSTLADLFAIVGTSYGSADGTHFNVPNLVNKFPRGVATTPGGTGGATTHTHPLSDAGQAAISLATASPHIRERRVASASWAPTLGEATAAATSYTTPNETVATALIGSTDSASSLPPYLDLLYIIKT